MTTRPPAQASAATVSTEYVDVDGSAIGYRTIGSGTPLVLLNRMRGTLDTWDPLFLDELAQAQRVVVVDYPGTGYSAGALPGDLGQVAQALLLQHPEAVSHAVLVGTTPPGPGQAEIQKVWLQRALKPVNDLDDEIVLFFEPASEASRRAAAPPRGHTNGSTRARTSCRKSRPGRRSSRPSSAATTTRACRPPTGIRSLGASRARS